jgi:alcohol dehydrogenase (cytochrome c)
MTGIPRSPWLTVLALALSAGSLSAQVEFDDLLDADRSPENWYMYSGTVMSQRYSRLTEINTENAGDLQLQWLWQSRSLEKFEATPLVVDGVMYTIQNPDDVVALDAATGRVFWIYEYSPSEEARPCCGRLSRGVAILGDALFLGTIDGRVISIDRHTGQEIWNVQVDGARPEAGYAFTHAPQIVKDKVIVGTAGGEFGIRGFIVALDAATGEETWRFYTIPGPGEPGHETWPEGTDAWMHGGASVWVTGSYDPEHNLTYWGIGNPGPDWNGDERAGDNLYSNSVVALDADTGELRWHFQFSPHDEFDYDAVQIPVLVDMEWEGDDRQLMLWANRNGFFYVLDRVTGEFLFGQPFVEVNWASGLDENGRPIRIPGMVPSEEGTVIFPGNQGGTNWYSPSFSPQTELFYIPSWLNYSSNYVKEPDVYVEGETFTGGGPRGTGPAIRTRNVNFGTDEEGYGAIRAINPRNGELEWQFEMADFTDAGVLTTASNVLFSGGRDGYFFALDARNGDLLWCTPVGERVYSGAMTYMVNGRQHVAVAAGNVLFSYALPE